MSEMIFISNILLQLIVTMIILVGVYSVGECVGNISLSEFQGLQALFVSTQGENWMWNPSFPLATQWHFSNSSPIPSSDLNAPCQDMWQGLNCSYSILPLANNKEGLCSIQNISLAGMNLIGTIPASLSQCSNVEVTDQE